MGLAPSLLWGCSMYCPSILRSLLSRSQVGVSLKPGVVLMVMFTSLLQVYCALPTESDAQYCWLLFMLLLIIIHWRWSTVNYYQMLRVSICLIMVFCLPKYALMEIHVDGKGWELGNCYLNAPWSCIMSELSRKFKVNHLLLNKIWAGENQNTFSLTW